jgi:hypothetical protein
MSLYRQAGRASGRTLALAAVAALLAGLLAGFLLGRSTAPDPTVAEKVADLRSRLRPAEQGLELTATEYAQAVRGGRVVQPPSTRPRRPTSAASTTRWPAPAPTCAP